MALPTLAELRAKKGDAPKALPTLAELRASKQQGPRNYDLSEVPGAAAENFEKSGSQFASGIGHLLNPMNLPSNVRTMGNMVAVGVLNTSGGTTRHHGATSRGFLSHGPPGPPMRPPLTSWTGSWPT